MFLIYPIFTIKNANDLHFVKRFAILLAMTNKRKILLNIFTERQNPMNATQVFKLLGDQMDLATVYRGLDYLEGEHYLQSFVFECHDRGIERYFYINKEVHQYFLHCEKCHCFFSAGNCPVDAFIGQIEEETGFSIRNHQLILKGFCKNCH